jgi:hypothetical protein
MLVWEKTGHAMIAANLVLKEAATSIVMTCSAPNLTVPPFLSDT